MALGMNNPPAKQRRSRLHRLVATRWGVLLMLPAISRRGRNGVSAPVKQAVGHIENLPPWRTLLRNRQD
jgi:hypothetical protein